MENLEDAILILEPDILLADLFVQKAKPLPWTIITRSTLEATEPFLSGPPPRLILAELHLTDGSALQLRRKILKNELWKDIPFLLITRERTEEIVRDAHRHGITHILQKPLFLPEVLGLMEIEAAKNR